MKRKLLTMFALIIFLSFSNSFAQELEVLLDQPMKTAGMTGATSALTATLDYEVADNFTNVDGTVTQIVFYGLYAFYDGSAWSNVDPGSSLEFNIRFYAEDATQPDWDNPLQEHLALPTTSIDAEAPWSNGFNVWKFTVDIPATYIDNGWISIQSSFGSGWLLWHNADGGDDYAWQVNHNAKTVVNPEFASIGHDTGTKDALAYDVAMQLLGTPGMIEGNTVVDIIVGSDDHTTLATAVTLAGLVEALSGEGPFTVFAPTDDAFDALPDGLLDALIADPEGDLTKVLLYHVAAGNVLSGDLTDGMVITTLLGQELTVTIDGGDVFINDVGGNSVQVTVPDLEADNGVVHVVNGVLIPDLTVQMFSVTFNVDMTEVEGFDPDVHDVYIAGSFGGELEWNEPGSNDDLKLTLVGPAKDGEVVVILEEGFEGAGFPPVNWKNVDGNQDGNAWFRYTAENSAHSGEASAASASWFDGTVLFPDNWLITPQLNIPNDTYMLEYYVGAQDPSWAEETYGIFISTTGDDPDDFGEEIFGETMEDGDWHFREISLADYAGEEIYIAFRHYNTSDMFYIKIDDVMVYGVAGDEPPVEDYIYTITLDLEEGDVQYKYFSTVIAAGWAGGEWEGDPNRVITVDADMTVDDVFGDQPVSVVENELAEQGINLFPNPVRNTLYVENSDLINDLRIFDLTGRMIFSQVVNDNATSINVSEFKTGVYIMQVMTVNGVVSKRFSVQ